MKTRLTVVVLLIFGIFWLQGCAYFTKKDDAGLSTQAALEPSGVLKFSDIPVPAGFKLLPRNSYSFESSGVRVGVLKYRGKASPEQVVNFYKEQMPMYNWVLLNVVEYGDRLMNFERENETCIIGLLIKGNTITITASLGPKPQISSKKPKQPIK